MSPEPLSRRYDHDHERAGTTAACRPHLHGIHLRPARLRRPAGARRAGRAGRPGAGRGARLASLALAGSLIPTTLAGHSYWTIEDPATRKIQRIQFHKNLAMIGGLLFAALDEPRTPPE